ncbi:class I tRNA ligase family protein [Streptomyces sp. NPDC091267]|uniref:class I tRNA ligase family protein n=1 Tax=Streptomyces sp. NPDC091267 TaxID=3155195 RepID=UPI0034462E4D
MSDALAALMDEVRTARPVDPAYFFFPGYLTPNGELHLGHVGGPYLRSDAAARFLRAYGAEVAGATASDAYESSVTYAAADEGAGAARAAEIAAHHTARAARALSLLGMGGDSFANPSAEPGLSAVAAHCTELAGSLQRAGRLTVREEKLLAGNAPAPETATGAFVRGTCPFCALPQSGNACEECGRWLDPASMESAWHPRSAGGTNTVRPVASVFVRTAPGFAETAQRGVVEPEFEYLLTDYAKVFGPWLRLSYPSWWGLAWPSSAGSPHPGSVMSSYVMGKYGSTRLLGDRERARTGRDPFRPGSGVTTVAVGGLDSAFGWLALHALADPSVDFAPFDHVVVNRFMLLRGEKFSTSRKHVIRANDALDEGITPDVLRLLLARVSPGTSESDFEPNAVAARLAADCDLLHAALDTSLPDGTEADPGAAARATAAGALARQRAAFALPAVELPAAAEALTDFAAAVADGVCAGSPRFARQTLAVLALPLLPGWAHRVWATACGTPPPGCSPDDAVPEGALRLVPVAAPLLDSLAERARLS